MMKVKILFLLLFLASHVVAQETSISAKDESDALIGGSAKKRILLFPFEPKFYMSNGADKDIIEKLKITQKDFVPKFQVSLDLALLKELKKKEPTISFLQSSNPGIQNDYIKFLGAVSYEFVPTSGAKKEKNTHIANGQLTGPSDNSEKYMNAYFNMADKDAMNTMLVFSKKYDTDYLVCINQVEINFKNNSGESAAYEKYGREIKVHYNIMTKSFNNISHGIVSIDLPGNETTYTEIESKYLPILASKIVTNIPAQKP